MKKFRILSAVLAVIMTLSLCACGKDADKGAENTTAPADVTTTAQAEETTEPTTAEPDEYTFEGKDAKITVPKLDSVLNIEGASYRYDLSENGTSSSFFAGCTFENSNKEIRFSIFNTYPAGKSSAESAEYFNGVYQAEEDKFVPAELAGFKGYCQTDTIESSQKTTHTYYLDIPCGDDIAVIKYVVEQLYDDDISELKSMEEKVLKSIIIEAK